MKIKKHRNIKKIKVKLPKVFLDKKTKKAYIKVGKTKVYVRPDITERQLLKFVIKYLVKNENSTKLKTRENSSTVPTTGISSGGVGSFAYRTDELNKLNAHTIKKLETQLLQLEHKPEKKDDQVVSFNQQLQLYPWLKKDFQNGVYTHDEVQSVLYKMYNMSSDEIENLQQSLDTTTNQLHTTQKSLNTSRQEKIKGRIERAKKQYDVKYDELLRNNMNGLTVDKFLKKKAKKIMKDDPTQKINLGGKTSILETILKDKYHFDLKPYRDSASDALQELQDKISNLKDMANDISTYKSSGDEADDEDEDEDIVIEKKQSPKKSPKKPLSVVIEEVEEEKKQASPPKSKPVSTSAPPPPPPPPPSKPLSSGLKFSASDLMKQMKKLNKPVESEEQKETRLQMEADKKQYDLEQPQRQQKYLADVGQRQKDYDKNMKTAIEKMEKMKGSKWLTEQDQLDQNKWKSLYGDNFDKPFEDAPYYDPQFGTGLTDDDGMNTNDINGLMHKYKEYKGCIGSDQISSVILPLVEPHTRICFIINTDKSTQRGEHWLACLIDARPHGSHSIEYYNSLGNNGIEAMPKDFIKKITPILKKLKTNTYMKVKQNIIKEQNAYSSNCGEFACRFLIQRLNNKGFADATKWNQKGEKKIEEWKKKQPQFKYIDAFHE
jgi:hypothetical protein